MTALLELKDVSAGYGHQLVIRNLSLAVQQGQVAALIGPNGHGKTTLLRAISGLIELRRGTITLAGRAIEQLRPDEIVAHGVVHVPQGDLLFPEMTVLENLRMGAYLPEAAKHENTRLEEVFTLLPRLKERRNQLASTLSGGERRMAGIGRGLMAGGRLLMLDEPSLGLAPVLIDQIYSVIQSLRRSGRTILIVEENAARVAEIADVLHLLDNGEFAWSGGGEELLTRPEILSTYLGG
jgi:branched-chain amino acid transport system ATP-binding protein